MIVQDDSLQAVNELFTNCDKNYKLLLEIKEVSFATEYKGQLAKVVLLACASFFEANIIDTVMKSLNVSGCQLTYNFVLRKALLRQYHALFDWKAKNANNFFSLFGEGFRDFMKTKVKDDESLDLGIKNFLELGRLRNQLTHDNYATFVLELTVEDIYEKFSSARFFTDKIESHCKEYRASIQCA